MERKIVLSFDLEFWHNSGFLKKYLPKEKNLLVDYIIESTEPILELLKKHGHLATFFVLGRVAEKYPELIKKIYDSGHEIASHGYSHKPLFDLNEVTFQKEIELTNNILKNITEAEPKGFRAPNFSLNQETKWALKIIEKNFRYDSSLDPLNFSKFSMPVLEIPPSLGGIYFRILPLKLYLFLAKLLSKQKIPVLYLHPYELFESSPKINSAPWHKKKIKYWGTKTAWYKFEKLLKERDSISIEEYLNEKYNCL